MLVSLIMATLPASAATSSSGYSFNAAAFASTWNKVDLPVQNQVSGAGRGYIWGPPVQPASTVTTESYNGTTRQVQYFDKARMEINNPNGDPNSQFYVTTGLLIKELVTGNLQTGDSSFTQLTPSTIQVAGDPNDNGANAIAPAYTSFAKVGTFNGTENWATSNTGNTITSQINGAGNVNTAFVPPEQHQLTGYDSVTHHNIADVFVNFTNQNGPLWDGSQYTNGSIFFGNPTYVLGRPVTEPYWTNAVVAGVQRQVLVQLFERRVLTYTPANSDPYKVEMGNVGQHYYKWRYGQNNVVNPPAQNPNQLSVYPASDYAGQPFQISGSGFAPNETVNLWETNPQNIVKGLPGIQSDMNGNINFTYKSHGPIAGKWAVTAHGINSGVEKVATVTLIDFVKGGAAYIQLSRTTAGVGASIDIHGYNFENSEDYSWWVTAPDGTVYPGTDNFYGHQATLAGNIFFRYVVSISKPGKWAITVHGLFSQRETVAYFTFPSQ